MLQYNAREDNPDGPWRMFNHPLHFVVVCGRILTITKTATLCVYMLEDGTGGSLETWKHNSETDLDSSLQQETNAFPIKYIFLFIDKHK